jgi:hypothetical protein
MTDGIIQKVIKKFVDKHRSKYYTVMLFHADEDDMHELMQELIAEIKALRDRHDRCHSCPCTYADELIGDNKE